MRRQCACPWWRSATCVLALAVTVTRSFFGLEGAVTAELTAEETQAWRLTNQDFDWQQPEPDAVVRVAGRGVEDADGNLYFAGSKTLESANVDDLDLFVARLNVDDTLGWTKQWGTTETDAATSISIVSETTATGATTQFLYVVGYTWGYLDEGGHALNGFGQYGGRDVVLLKLSLAGDKLWLRQFGSTANDMGYGVSLDGSFASLLLSGGCTTHQTDVTVELSLDGELETRQHTMGLSDYEAQLMDPRPRAGAAHGHYDFAVSLNLDGDILDFAMDGGVTLAPRRRRIREDGLVAEYAVVLNRQPLEDVTVHAQDVRLSDPSGEQVQQLVFETASELVFTPNNWNQEQLVRVRAVDDARAEGRHYAVITHSVSSADPNFNGLETPFLAGRTVTLQIDDNDRAGVVLSRTHVFVGEGGGEDSYDITLTSRPWHPVTVVITPLHASQTAVIPAALAALEMPVERTAELVFQPEDWDVPQRVVVRAVDDSESESEYGGLHAGGPLLHYTKSKDIRYHTRRPQCFDVPNCDPLDASSCLLAEDELQTDQTSVRVCDLTNECDFAMGNGACITHAVAGGEDGVVPERFGSPPLDPAAQEDVNTGVQMSYTSLRELLVAQQSDADLALASDLTLEFVAPPPELRGFVLSFLGLMNVEQARQMSTNPKRTLHTICSGLVRLETMRWAFEEWPDGYVARVLAAVFTMFPQSYMLERHAWNCGMATFLPGSSIEVSVWDNDPGVTLSAALLEVSEGETLAAEYMIVLNAPPAIGGVAQFVAGDLIQPSSLFCQQVQSDVCGFWGNDFSSVAMTVYDHSAWEAVADVDAPNVSIAIVGNSQVVVEPTLVTFSATDWFVPQRVAVRAVDDAVAELDASYTLSHRVQNSDFGYTDATPFWFQDTFAPAGAECFPFWTEANGGSIPYNPVPTVLRSPAHQQINVLVRDDDAAGVNVIVNQPSAELSTKEALDPIDWVGDYATALAFDDVSLSMVTANGKTTGSLISSILEFAGDTVTLFKFHVPQLHDGDSTLVFSGATLVLHQTPYKIFNVSEIDSDSGATTGALRESAAVSEEARFAKVYRLKVTAVDNAWTPSSVANENPTTTPAPLDFLQDDSSVEVSATVEKSRSIEVDVSALLAKVIPTRLAVVSLRIEVIAEGDSTESIATTQLCSSLFERALRPKLSLAYKFPNLLLGLEATQSSTAVSSQSGELLSASLATNGEPYDNAVDSQVEVATTESEDDPWWEVTLPDLTKLGTLAVFVPASILPNVLDTDNDVHLVLIASLTTFDAQPLSLLEALAYGCPEACPRMQRMAVRRGILLWDVQAGARAVRIYREGNGVLQLAQVQAFDSFVEVTPTADGSGVRSRSVLEWGPNDAVSDSWRLLQTVRGSEDENLASGMATRQSSTSPSHALSLLAVDGQRHTVWDSLAVLDKGESAMEAGSMRTEEEEDPWWEVDLGEVKAIRSVVLYPYVGGNFQELCALETEDTATVNGFPAWSGDLRAYSRTDPLLQLETPFQQDFEVLLSDEALMNSNGEPSGAVVTASVMLSFSCAGHRNSIAWDDVFSRGRFLTVRKQGLGVLMLNEVEVRRWNPATTSQLLLLDLFGKGDKPLALNSVQVFPPGDEIPTDAGLPSAAFPIQYKIYSVSSQLSSDDSSASGTAMALLDAADSSQCYVAGSVSYHEWVILEFDTPVPIGLIEINTDVTQCGADVAPVDEISVSSRGASLEGIRSPTATQTLHAAGSAGVCELDAMGVVVALSSECLSFVCSDAACQSPLRAENSAGVSVVLSDFVDITILGKVSLLPMSRVPLSQHEHRALVLRDNPVMFWAFDGGTKVFVPPTDPIAAAALWEGKSRVAGTFELMATTESKRLGVEEGIENTFSSSAVATQPALRAFSAEFWVLFSEESAASEAAAAVLTLYSTNVDGAQQVFGRVGIMASAAVTGSVPESTRCFFFELKDPDSGTACRAELEDRAESPPLAATWQHIVATYDSASSSVSLSIRAFQQTTKRFSSTATCTMAIQSMPQKVLHFGAPSVSPAGASPSGVDSGFVGNIASVAWYARALTDRETLDHFHDFLDGVVSATKSSHNTYAVQLASKPLQSVTVQINSETACYRFNLCNTSVVPSTLVFTPENWAVARLVHVLGVDDQLYEGAHDAELLHTSFSAASYQLTTSATTASVNTDDDQGAQLLQELEDTVTTFYRDSEMYVVLGDSTSRLEREAVLAGLQIQWAAQLISELAVAANAYNDPMSIAALPVRLIDLTIPGIEFSTNSLSVSEAGNGNDYQIVLLSEPKQEVQVSLHIASGCYRSCFVAPLCPSKSAILVGGEAAKAGDDAYLSCGDDSESMSVSELLCNVTVSPDMLLFSGSDWNFPQTVRVVAVDDHLDEADVHFATIRTTSQSLDPIYDQLVLPDIMVAIEDNDATDVAYSTKLVALAEKEGGLSTLGYPQEDFYTLRLLTEPYADVTIAMSNEANESCYRRCGYDFDNALTCGLPRQQSVSLVQLRSDSTREIHEIALHITKVTEVQRIVTYAEHVDQIFRVRVSGGFGAEVQVIVFKFSDAFRLRFPSSESVTTASSYGRTFQIRSDDGTTTIALDGFASASQVQTAINGLFPGETGAVTVTRRLEYALSTLTWTITFLRLVRESASGFSLLSVETSTDFEGSLTVQRSNQSTAPTGSFQLRYGASTVFDVPVIATAAELKATLKGVTGVYMVSTNRKTLTTGAYGFEYTVAMESVETFGALKLESSASVVASPSSTTKVSVSILETQAPRFIDGSFVVDYFSPIVDMAYKSNRTKPIFWNDTAETLAEKLVQLHGVGNVSVTRRQLSAEGGMEWTVQFKENNGDLPLMIAQPLNLTGLSATVVTNTVRNGESLRGSFAVQMGGLFKKTDPRTNRAYMKNLPLQNSTALAFDVSAEELQRALFTLNITEIADVERAGVECDVFAVCNGYTWTISYRESPGNLPPIEVFVDSELGGAPGMTLSSTTLANGTYLGGTFSLTLELLDPETDELYVGTTWRLPVNVSAVGMDQALEALSFVRSNREAEYDAETRVWRGIKFDKGVRVYRDGPYLDGGHTWRLEWALEDYTRFADLKITMDTSLITQEIEPLPVPSELDLDGKPRCDAIPRALFQPDLTDPFGLRGHCVYAIANETVQERFLCNYTVLNPWIVFTPENWCVPQRVNLAAVDDFLDETSVENGLVTFSEVTHTVFGDDLLYTTLPLSVVTVEVESDDFAEVIVSESRLEVSEDGKMIGEYYVELSTEPLYDVRLVVLPWLDGEKTQCYRFGLCNLTLPTDEFLFTPRNWNLPQKVTVLATDDDLDEYDTHATGISHISYSDDPKYNEIPTIPRLDVTVHDNDVSGFIASKTNVSVTEGSNGVFDTYSIVLTTEPFAKVTVTVTNVGDKGNLAIATPTQLVFTWRNWNISQTVRVTALDDYTEDVKGSSSMLQHSLKTNDLNYAALRNLAAVKVFITDNDVSGLELSTNELYALESNVTKLTYRVRLKSEPWHPVKVMPNANHDCYLRVQSGQQICNASISSASRTLYFGAANWSVWQNVSLIAVDDWLDEAMVHTTRISHASTSVDPLYTVADYTLTGGDLTLFIEDNDVSFVNISLQSAKTQLHVAEGSFDDSYRLFLNSEPYEDVVVTLLPTIEEIVSLDDPTSIFNVPQVGISYSSLASSSRLFMSSADNVKSVEIVFTPLDWALPRVVTVFAIDDEISEDATQYSTITHAVESADAHYAISNSSIGVVSVPVMISDKEAIPPPLPETAIFDASGSRVDIAFDSTVYHAATMSVSTSGAYVIRLKTFSCDLVFNLKAARYSLGSKAFCLWLDSSNLRMELGSGSTIAASDVLVLTDCSSFENQVCNATNVIRARHSSRAYSQASVTLDVPDDIIKPNVVLVVPENVGSCGGWEADAALSSGAGGRPFLRLTWFALPSSLFPSTSALASPEEGLTLSQRLYESLEPLCSKYATDWTTGQSSSTLIPAEDLALAINGNSTAAEDLSMLSTMRQLRSACYLRSVVLDAADSGALTLLLNSSLLESGAEYRVGLEIVNAFAQHAVVSKPVQLSSLPGPAVSVVGETTRSIKRVGAPLVMQVDTVVSCPEVSGTNVAYRWTTTSRISGDASSAVTTQDFSKANTARDPRIFRLPRSALTAGRVYTFQVEAYMADLTADQASSSFASIQVTVTSSKPIVSIAGGDCAIGDRDTLVLDGSGTTDPDLSSTPFSFQWSCKDLTGVSDTSPTPSTCMNASTSSATALDLSRETKSVLTIAPFNLESGHTLQFSLTASKDTRSATTTSVIWIEAGNLPVVSVTASASKINPSSRITLVADVSSAYPYTARWAQTQGDLVLPEASSGTDKHDAFVLPLTSLRNVIRKNKLTAGLTYDFRLVATDMEGGEGFGTVSVAVNSPPTSGSFVVSPRSGIAIEDTFTLTCAEWSDDADDFPLSYTFGVVPTLDFETLSETTSSDDSSTFVALLRQVMTPLVSDQPSPQAETTMLPPSGMQDSEQVTVVALISDVMGAVAIAYDTVEVMLPAEAKTMPIVYVSSMFTTEGELRNSGDASRKVRQVLSVAMVLESTFANPSSSTTTGRRLASVDACPDGFMGPDCSIEVAIVQKVNADILSTLASAVVSVEPSSSSLGQQARVLGSVMRAAPEVLAAGQLSQVAMLSSGIANSALTLESADDFLESTGSTLAEVVSAVLSLEAPASSSDSSASFSQRRLTMSAASSSGVGSETVGDSACEDQEESEQTKKNLANLLHTLQSLAALSSKDLLADEPAVELNSSHVNTFAAKGVSFTSPTSALAMNLTSISIACLESDLFLSAFALSASSHSSCTLNKSEPISRSTVFTVHSQSALDQAAQMTDFSSESGVVLQTLSSSDECVVETESTRRRLATEESSATTRWNPLVALTIPHERELSAIEQTNFSTACRVWDPEGSSWAVDVCFKDAATSTFEVTVCYCTQLDAQLEVLVTLEERLAFYALHPDLYRSDPPSMIVSITLVILVAFFSVVTKTGQRLDERDAQREKAMTIKRLNRSKWSELQARTQTTNVFESFDDYYTRKKLERHASEAQVAGLAHGEASTTALSTTVHGSRTVAPLELYSERTIDPSVELPDETRTLFESSRTLSYQYAHVTTLFRLGNLLLVLLGVVLTLAGIEVLFVLGRSPTELVLYLYGGPLGLALTISGALLLIGGVVGVLLASREASNSARTTYLMCLSAALLTQLVAVAFTFHYLENFHDLPQGVALQLYSRWTALSADDKTALQSSYGCCGFLAVHEEAACPEEALAAVPARTCSRELGAQAQTLVSSSFGYLEMLFFVEAACVALANLLVRWRHLRLLQLAGTEDSAASSNDNGNGSAGAAMLRSQTTVMLLCSLPPLYGLLACVAAAAVLYGADLLFQWRFVANMVVSALFGIETGVMMVAVSAVYLLTMLRALHTLGTRDVRGLRWVVGIFFLLLVFTMALIGYVGRLHANFHVDPSIEATIEARYVALPKDTTKLELEMALQCCGFRNSTQGSCVLDDASESVPACRSQVTNMLERALTQTTTRLSVFAVAQAILFVLTAWLGLRLRRFSRLVAIHPTPEHHPPPPPLSFFQHSCVTGLTLLSAGIAAGGIATLCLGVDVLFELNVLQVSYLLRVFDRRLGVYLLAAGGAMEVFAVLGGLVAWTRRSQRFGPANKRNWLVIGYVLACTALFLAALGTLGVSHKLETQLMPLDDNQAYQTAEAAETRLQDLWRQAPSPTKQFVQNTLTCCGYERVEASNGSVFYTLPAEQRVWRPQVTTTSHYVYAESDTASRRLRELTEMHAEAVTTQNSSLCPSEAWQGCAEPMKTYVARIARIAWQLSISWGAVSVAAVFFSVSLYRSTPPSRSWTPSWKLRVLRAMLLFVVLLDVFAALASLFLGVDIALGWTLFSSSALQLLFAESLGGALIVYAMLALLTHVYTTRAALSFTVHQLFLQSVLRVLLASALFGGLALTAHLSHYSAATDESWRRQLTNFLDERWSELAPTTQHAVALELACCGFNDPVLVADVGIVFDRPALGFPACSLAISRGCKTPLVTGVASSFGWLAMLFLGFALAELTLAVLGAFVLRSVTRYEHEAWFKIESRLRYAAGSFRRDFRQRHLFVSVAARYDSKLTRAQRAISVLCSWAASLAAFAAHFATQGCHRTALNTCEQPGAGELIGLALLYGGIVGLSVQTGIRLLFELVRNRAEDESKEVASARQRKEKVLLFRTSTWFGRRRKEEVPAATGSSRAVDATETSTVLAAAQSTTEERWYAWLTRFVAVSFQSCGVLLFLGGCALATLLGLLQLGYKNSLYGVPLNEGVLELLMLAGALVVVALLAALANDLREQLAKRPQHRRASTAIVALVVVAGAALLALSAIMLAVFMLHEVTQEDATALSNWSVRVTGFSVDQRLEIAWRELVSGFFKASVQQELRCCGFQNATDAPILPCPDGDIVDVAYEAQSVSGAVLTKTTQELRPLPGCRELMLARFQHGADAATIAALCAVVLLFLLAASALFLARDLALAKDAKLKLRVPESSETNSSRRDLRQTFEKVVGLKIAAPARGKLRSQLLASSLDHVTPSVVSELAAGPLVHDKLVPASDGDTAATNKLEAEPGATQKDDEVVASVPYPASVVYVIFALCLLFLGLLGYAVALASMELGVETSWHCVLAWAMGVGVQELVAEPMVLLVLILARTLREWWADTFMARLLRRGRAALRVRPLDKQEVLSKSLTLYEHLRFAAAVRIQRRLLTRVTRQRYLRRLRAHKQEQHRLLAAQRRETLRKTLNAFSAEETEAFRLLFETADAAQIGLVSHTAIARAVYELGVHVPAATVRELLAAFDPAYADLVDFEHFLYGMHCVRLHHQQRQAQAQASESSESVGTSVETEQLMSSSTRFGPRADPRATLLVKRQNLLRELRDRRESLAHKLLSKVSGRLPPLLQRGKSARALTSTPSSRGSLGAVAEGEALTAEAAAEVAAPTGGYVFWQNRKLSPKKLALEAVLKKKHRDRIRLEQQEQRGVSTTHSSPTTARAAVEASDLSSTPRKASVSPTRRAMQKLASWKSPTSPRAIADASEVTVGDAPPTPPEGMTSTLAAPPVAPVAFAGDQEDKPAVPLPFSGAEGSRDGSAARPAENVDSAPETSSKQQDAMEKSGAAPEEQPFGAYMLLTKQTPPLPLTGRGGDVLARIRQKQQTQKAGDSAVSGDAQVDAIGGAVGEDEDGVSETRPSSAEKPKPSGPQSSLEKALSKKRRKSRPAVSRSGVS